MTRYLTPRCRRLHRWPVSLAPAILLLGGNAPLTGLAQEEWWETTPYYEEDAWWDITEWFDGNDYHPTEETVWDWNEEPYADVWNEGDGGGEDDGSGEGRDEAWAFGYDDRYDDDNWFYDYWDEGYTAAYDWDGDGNYDYSYSYADFDGDGFYDGYYTYNDVNDDGIYERVEYFGLDDPGRPQRQAQTQDQPRDQRQAQAQDQPRDQAQDQARQAGPRPAQRAERRSPGETVRRQPQGQREQTGGMSGQGHEERRQFVEQQRRNNQRNEQSQTEPRRFEPSLRETSGTDRRDQERFATQEEGGSPAGTVPPSNRQQRPASAREHRVRGEVLQAKRVSVRDTKNLVVQVREDEGRRWIVDLGEASELEDFQIREGTQLAARGPLMQVGDKQVVLARSFQADGRSAAIERRRQTLRGEVAGTRRATFRDREQLFAILSSSEQRKTLVDLGPAERFPLELSRGEHFEVSGAPALVDGRHLLMAHEVTAGDRTVSIDRSREGGQAPASRQPRAGEPETFQVSGDVVGRETMTVGGSDRRTITVRESQGRRLLIDLGPADAAGIDVREGDRVQAEGPMVKARDGRPVLLARSIRSQGRSTSLRATGETGEEARFRPARSVTGEVVDLRQARLRDEPRQLARIKTEEGATVIVDLGSPGDLRSPLTRGERVTVHGIPVPSPEGAIFLAERLDRPGEDTVVIRRLSPTSGQQRGQEGGLRRPQTGREGEDFKP